MSRRFNAIVFDFDGVLVESVDVKTRAFVELYRPYGEVVMRAVAAYHLEHGGVSRHEKFRHFHRTLLGQTLSKDEEDRLAARFSCLVEDAVVEAPWVAGAREFIEAHYREIPLHVASATPTDELLRIMSRRSMRDYFHLVAGAPQRKGSVLQQVIAAGGHFPGRVLMIGDALTDFDGAREARAAFLGRVAKAARNPFPDSVPVVEDLWQLSVFLNG